MPRADAHRLATVVAVLVGLLTAAAPALADPHPDTYDARDRTDYELAVENELLRLHNEARTTGGAAWGYSEMKVPAMSGWTDIRAVARGWAQEMAKTAPCADHAPACHNVPPHSDFPFSAEYGCHDYADENVYYAFAGYGGHEPQVSPEDFAADVMDAFMQSEGHRSSLMEPGVDEFAVGVHIKGETDARFGDSSRVWVAVNFRDRTTGCDVDGSRYFGDADPDPDPEPSRDVSRARGDDRVHTAIKLTERLPAADTVLVAYAGNYPDALAAAPLAGVLDAPLLLTGADGLDGRVGREIDRLGASTVVLLGGTSVLSDRVAADADAVPGVTRVERIEGPDRFATAVEAAALTVGTGGWDGTVLLVEGANSNPSRGWPDALAASAYAARTGTPILLTTHGSLPSPTRQALADMRPSRLVVVGGEVAVTHAVASRAASAAGLSGYDRWDGPTRYATSMAVDERTPAGPGPVFLATGLNFADALAAGPVAGLTGGTLLLVHGHDTSEAGPVAAHVDANHAAADVVIAGGTYAVNDPVMGLFR